MTNTDKEDAVALIEEAVFRLMDSGLTEKQAIKTIKKISREL